jgi:alpha-L-fucosidase
MTAQTPATDPLRWLRDARFGLFIHWGLYASPHPPHWRPQELEQQGEWIMYSARVPLDEYRRLADRFNPREFDADTWVRMARDAGMRYLVYTAKHCDGFAMYKSAHPYNLVDATPFGRDPLRELADACQRHGLKLGLYYSQAIDWEHPGAARWHALPPEARPGFARYLEEKAFPQVRELLIGYGPIALLWFDNPTTITAEQSQALRRLAKSLQPDCLINSRIGHGAGDYGSLGDNMIPGQAGRGLLECPATLNDTWGYLPNDRNWKSASELVRQLVTLADRDANYLLNVGPTARGTFPRATVTRLRRIGAWMRRHGEAIYGSAGNPFPAPFPWGRVTTKPGCVFLHVFGWPAGGRLVLRGLRNRVTGAVLLARPDKALAFRQGLVAGTDVPELELTLPPRAPDPQVSVIALAAEGPPDVDVRLLQDADGNIELTAGRAERLADGTAAPPRLDPGLGVTAGWTSPAQWLRWRFVVTRPGHYEAELVTRNSQHVASAPRWLGGHRVALRCADRTLTSEVRADRPGGGPRARYHAEAATLLGEVEFPAPGECAIELRAELIEPAVPWGLSVDTLRLTPVEAVGAADT